MALEPAGMILAAGFGTRLKPLTNLRPKPLMEIGGEAIIFYLINKLINSGIKEIYINLCYKSEQIIKYIKNLNLAVSVNFSLEEEILGTAGGIRQVVNKFKIRDRDLIILNGDIWCDVDLNNFLPNTNYATLICAKDYSAEGYAGNIKIDENNNILELGRYYKAKNINFSSEGFFTGVHILSPQALDALMHDHRSCLVGSLYPAWLNEHKNIKAFMLDLDYEDLGSLERLLAKNLKFLSDTKRTNLISPDALIEEGASIGPHVIIGAGAHIKKGAHIKNSVIMSNTVIEKDEVLNCALALLNVRVAIGITKRGIL